MKDVDSCRQFMINKLERNLEEKTISLFQGVYIEITLEYIDILNCKLVYTSIISGIDFRKNVNEPIDKKFVYFYQSHINIHI